MQLYQSRLSYFNDKARINYCKSPSVHQHGGRSRPRQNCHSCIFKTNENSNLRICIQYLGHHSKTTCQKSAKSMRYRVRPKFEFYRKSLLRNFRLRCSRRVIAIELLSGNSGRSLNGSGISQCPCSVFLTPSSIILRNCKSS